MQLLFNKTTTVVGVTAAEEVEVEEEVPITAEEVMVVGDITIPEVMAILVEVEEEDMEIVKRPKLAQISS